MSDIMKAIAILQRLRDTMCVRHCPNVPYGVDLSEEIDELAEAIALLSPPEAEPAGKPDDWDTPPEPIVGAWQSCEHGIDAEDGDWVLLAWPHKRLGWKYAAAQVTRDVDAEDNSESIELLDWGSFTVDCEPSHYFIRIAP